MIQGQYLDVTGFIVAVLLISTIMRQLFQTCTKKSNSDHGQEIASP
jgi:hypothetical protein